MSRALCDRGQLSAGSGREQRSSSTDPGRKPASPFLFKSCDGLALSEQMDPFSTLLTLPLQEFARYSVTLGVVNDAALVNY